MRLKILSALMVCLAVVLIVLEVQYHYLYWSLAPKPKAIPRFLESRSQQEPVEPAVAVEAETPAQNPAGIPAETSSETSDGTPAEVQAEVGKSAS